MNYYNEIKNKLIDNEIYGKVKDYSKERNRVKTYFEIGRLLSEAGSKYGKSIINEFSKKLMVDVGKKYNYRSLYRMRKLYEIFVDEKLTTMLSKLTWSHYLLLLSFNDTNKIYYYIKVSEEQNLDVRSLKQRIISNEYERLPESTRNKLINKEKSNVDEFVKNPIIIKNRNYYDVFSEKVLKKLILEDIENFLEELGSCFTFIKSEYPIKIGDRYNYIDFLLYNIKYKCYVVVELKITELKKEHTGQIQIYMNYIDKNIRTIEEDKTVGIIICKKDNKFVMEYCSDDRIISREYELL